MKAEPGDWVIVQGRVVGGAARRGLIEEVRGKGGEPPYLVHWVDDGRRVLFFPGPDTQIVSGADLRASEQSAAARYPRR
ncbi:DUF1918 domain-containing protein [Nocardia crassostreae]|uniref:DUF1918 domain-containing protein n=1 Tax=Nocardia crassostreae TaxID=53428 RepID=UPI000836CF5A|nr:DUF1918 domain-containing protein [Nocardia crassostreae]